MAARTDHEIREAQIDTILSALIEIVRGNFEVRLPVTDRDSPIDAIHAAINTTADELACNAAKHEQDEEQLRRHTEQLEVLWRTSRVFSSSLDFEQTCQAVLDGLVELPQIDAASIMVCKPGTTELESVATRELSPEEGAMRTARTRLQDGLPAIVAQQKAPLVVVELMEDGRVAKRDILEQQGLQSYLGVPLLPNGESPETAAQVPLRAQGTVLGVLNVYSKKRRDLGEIAGVLQNLATQLAAALDSSRLNEDARQQAEALRASEEKYRTLTESLHELVYRANPKTFAATYVNKAIESIYGYGAGEWLEDPTLWERSVHPDDQARVFAAFTKAQQDVEGVQLEYRIIRSDETVRWVQDRATWEKDQQGNVVSLIGVMQDITERKQAEEQTKQLQEYLQLQIERMPIGLIVWDTEFRVTSWNPAAQEMFGFTAQEALGKHPYNLIVPEEAQPQVDGIWRRLLEGDTTAHGMNDNMTKDGRTIFCQWSNTPLREADGTVRGVLSMVQDITVSKRAEEAKGALVEQLRIANETMERQVVERTADLRLANEELESFAYSVSHDLRAPLRSMGGFSKALLEEHADRLDTRGRHYLERIHAGAATMEQLIDGMLQLSRLSRSELKREDIDLADLARKLAASLREDEPGRRVDFVIPDRLPANGDQRLLGSVMQNLLGNAWKFTAREPGARIELGLTAQQEYFVRDNGVGFDEQYADKLFGVFQRLHSSAEFEGLGVGLATVRRIVRRHGGDIRAEGVVGGGATFSFTLEPVGSSKKDT